MKNRQRRVVVTGLGLVTPIGIGVEANWDSLMKGRSGVGLITRFDTTEYVVKIAAEVKGFNPDEFVDKKDQKQMDLFSIYALAAAKMAMTDSGLTINDTNAPRIGTLVGAGLGGLHIIEE